MLSAYSSSVINLSNHLTTSLGITAQYFTLNKNWTVEPRAALKWSFNPKHALALAYGLHSRREKLDYYFVEQEANGKPNPTDTWIFKGSSLRAYIRLEHQLVHALKSGTLLSISIPNTC